MPVNIRLEDPRGVFKKLNWNILAEPETQDILRTASGRMQRQGKGLGAQRNTIAATVTPLAVRAQTTLNPPRTKGTAYKRNMTKRFLPPVMRNATRKAAKNILKRWAS